MSWQHPFQIDAPTRIRFGWGVRRDFVDLAENTGARRVLFIVSERALACAPVTALREALRDRNIETFSFDDVQPNPRTQAVDACAQEYASAGIDHLVGIGGGSALDQAKATAMALATGKSMSELLGLKERLPKRSNLLTLMPTTSGTGAEVSWGAIMTDQETGVKTGLRGRTLAADYAYIDPELTVTAPLDVTMITGFDVLTHALETYLSRKASPYTEGLSRQAIEIVFTRLVRLKADLGDAESRSAMAYASMLMGINLGLSTTCLPHRLQYPLGAATDTSHAEGLASLYPAWLAATRPFAEEKLARCAGWIGVGDGENQSSDAKAFQSALIAFMGQIDMRRTMTQLGVNRDMALEFVGRVTGNLSTDPGETSTDALRDIYLRSL